MIYKIVLEDQNHSVRQHALVKIDEPEILEKIVSGSDFDPPLEKLFDAAEILDEDIAFSLLERSVDGAETVDDLRFTAVANLRRQAQLRENIKIALTNDNPHVRSHVAMKLSNQDILETIARKDVDETVREAIVPLLNNEKLVEKIALEDKSAYVVVEKLSNLHDYKLELF